MYYSQNLQDLAVLSKLGSDTFSQHNNALLTLGDIQRDVILATLLSSATITPLLLNKENVNELLSGKIIWTGRHGTELKLKTKITIDELINSGIISFYNDYLKINIHSIPDKEQTKNKKLLQIISKLHSISYDNELKPYFRINKLKAHELMLTKGINENLENLEEVELFDDYYIISLKNHRGYRQLHDNLIAELFSNAKNDENQLTFNIDKWMLIAQIFPNLFLTDIDVSKLNYEQRHQLVQASLEKIENDQQLNVSPLTLTMNWTHINPYASWYNNNSENEQCTEKASPFYQFTISDFVTYFESSLLDQQILPLDFKLKANFSGWSNLGFNALSRYFFLPLHIVNIDLFTDVNSFRTLGFTDKLFSLSDSRPELKYILLCGLAYKNPNYLYYLLQRKDTACLAIYYYKEFLLQTFNSHNQDNNSTIAVHIFGKVCDEFIRHYFNENHLSKRYYQQLSLLLETLSRSAIRNDWAGMPLIEKTIIDTLLDKIATHYLANIEGYLIEPDSLEVRTTAIGKLYLLFNLIEKHQTCPCETSNKSIAILEGSICQIVKYSFSAESIKIQKQLRACNFLDRLPWWRLSNMCVEQHMTLVESWTKFSRINQGLNIGEYTYIQIQRTNLQIMLNMITTQRDSAIINLVYKKCLSIINNITDDFDDGLRLLFKDFFQGAYPLWSLFTSMLDKICEDNFDSILSVLNKELIADLILSLLNNTSKKSRQDKIKKIIDEQYIINSDSLTKIGLHEISEAVNFACIHNYVDYAETLISQAKKLIKKKYSTNTSQQHIDLWESIEYKVNILKICKDNVLSKPQKIERINELNDSSISSRYRHDCDQFRRNSFATLYIDSDPERASIIYNQLYRQTGSLFYAGNRLSAKFNLLLQNNANVDSYQTVLNEWLQASKDTPIVKIEDVFVQVWMRCLYELKYYNKIEDLWCKLLPHQKYTLETTKIYVRTLQSQYNLNHAIQILNELKSYHNIVLEDAELNKLCNDIQNGLIDGMDSKVIIAMTQKIIYEPKSTEELSNTYSQIFTRPISDIAMIINTKKPTVEAFLIENVRAVVSELLCMKIHLNRKDKNREFKLINENIINSWFTSLFKNRGTYAGISCHEQEPSGISPSGKNKGEIDFFFYAQFHDHRIAIGEAFNLNRFDRRTINSHIDKIAQYDQQSLDIVIFFAWCNVNNFIELTDNYKIMNNHRMYKGFQPAEDFSQVENTDTLVILKEVRLRHNKPITIYHFLANFRP
ncbi:hypothetical protein [Pectobacterium punjabense]|uniref:hypothetical protein n=1 Tax=Pectobacterium punjabense TaxID=2108399 RepID=UPI0038264375